MHVSLTTAAEINARRSSPFFSQEIRALQEELLAYMRIVEEAVAWQLLLRFPSDVDQKRKAAAAAPVEIPENVD